MKKITLIALMAACVFGASSCKQEKAETVAVVAHRGYWNCEAGGNSHNSIASLKAAGDQGFWGSEFDVNMSADSVLLVFHDGKINGQVIDQTPAEAFADYRLNDGETIPTLQEYLAVFNQYPKTTLVFELKKGSTPESEVAATELSIQALKDANLYDPSRVIFISFSMNICETLAKETEGFTIQYLDTDYTPAQAKEHGCNGIDTEYTFLLQHPEWIGQAHELGMSVNTWTVNKEEDIKALIELGVDQITTNEPELARQLIVAAGKAELKN